MIYLYNYAGQPWKSQYRVREVLNKLYNYTPDGYCGDEDNGQTSAWYIFSAMGFYPVCPGSNQYVLGSPLFNKIEVDLFNGKTIEINAPDNNNKNIYVKDLLVNGKKYSPLWLDHANLMKGCTVDFRMTDTPVRNKWNDADLPYSFSRK
jgi:predicted alpha-1,2-mannosidase